MPPSVPTAKARADDAKRVCRGDRKGAVIAQGKRRACFLGRAPRWNKAAEARGPRDSPTLSPTSIFCNRGPHIICRVARPQRDQPNRKGRAFLAASGRQLLRKGVFDGRGCKYLFELIAQPYRSGNPADMYVGRRYESRTHRSQSADVLGIAQIGRTGANAQPAQ